MTPQARELLDLSLPALRDYALLLLDGQGIIVGWLCGAGQIFGYTEQEVLGQPAAMLFVPEDIARGLHRLELEIAATDSFSQDDRWHVRKDGTRIWASGTVTAIRQGSTLVGFAKLMRDRTDMRIATEANANLLASANEALERTRSFLQTLGHELRNPLAPIKNSAYLLNRLSEDPRIQKIAQTIQNQVASMERITADLMDVARLEHRGLELRLVEADVRTLVQEEVGGLLLPAKAKGLDLLTLVPEAPLTARIDPDRIRQAVTNLLTNAIKYTPEGGTVYAKVTLEGRDAVIRVEDTGIGIAPEMLPRLFELFTRDTRARDLAPSGLGVGLAMVRQIAQLHGGVASARSAGEGKGAEFALRLPQAGPPNVARS